MKRQKGFSLIELVMIIVILGILAVAAIPRHVDLRQESQRETKEMAAIKYAGYLHEALAVHVADHYLRGTEWVKSGEELIGLLEDSIEMPQGMIYKNNSWLEPETGIEWEFIQATKSSTPRIVRKR